MDDLIQYYYEPGNPFDPKRKRSGGRRRWIGYLFRVVLPVCLALVVVGGAVWWGVNSYQSSVEALEGMYSEVNNGDEVAELAAERVEAVRKQLPFIYGIIFFTPIMIVVMTVALIYISRTSQRNQMDFGRQEVPVEEWHRRVQEYQKRFDS